MSRHVTFVPARDFPYISANNQFIHIMKKMIFMGAIALCALCSCNGKSDHGHDGHDHATEAHNHEQHAHEEGHNHEQHAREEEGHSHDHEGDAHAEGAHAEGSNEIVMPPAKAQAAGVEVSTVEAGSFQQVIKTSGQVMAAQGNESMAVASVAGVVSFKRNVTEGMSVSKGSPLLVLSSQNMAEGDPVQKARVAYEVAQKEYERMKALVGSRIVSEKEFAQARQAYENARISYEAVAKNHSEGGQTITAPIAGYIKSLLVKEGDYVQVGQPLVSITQNRKLYLKADVSERYYTDLPTIATANFCTPYNNKVYALTDLGGRLLSYGKATDQNSHYLPITFEFDNRGDMIPGSFVEVYLLGRTQEGVISLPRTALTEEQGSYFVYLQLDEECYRKQLVTPGADNGQRVQILSGLEPGQRVVVKGAYQVKLAGASNAIPAHSHEH